MIYIGLDVSLSQSGVALLEVENKKLIRCYAETVSLSDIIGKKMAKDATLKEERLVPMVDTIMIVISNLISRVAVLKNVAPDDVFLNPIFAMEGYAFVKSSASMTKLAEVRGALLWNIYKKYKITVNDFSPSEARANVFGVGAGNKGDKEWYLKHIRDFGINMEFSSLDASDAFVVALCNSVIDKNLELSYNRNLGL